MNFDEEYFKSDEFQELLSSYEESMETGSTPFLDVDDLVDIADYYNYKGNVGKAVETVDKGLEFFPNDTLLNVFKARQALLRYDFDEARRYADAIDDKDAPDYHYLLAEIMIAEGHLDDADRFLRDLYHTLPSDELKDYVKDVANLYIDYNVSDKAYEWMLRSQGDDSDDFKELMARTLFGLGKYKDSQRLFNELIDRNPYSKDYWNALASAQFMDEDYSASIASSEYAIAIDPADAEGLLSKANGLFKLGNYDDAIDYYRRYLQQDPGDSFAHLHVGGCLMNIGKTEEAIAELERALRCDDCDDDVRSQVCQELAFCYANLHDTDKALAILDTTRTLDCNHDEMLVLRGHILLRAGRLAEAEKAFTQAMRRSDGDLNIILRIIVSLYENHHVSASYTMFKRFFELTADDDFPDGYSYMALCCLELAHPEEFLHYLKEAVARNPEEARVVLGHLFPEGMEPAEYYDYMKGREKIQN